MAVIDGAAERVEARSQPVVAGKNVAARWLIFGLACRNTSMLGNCLVRVGVVTWFVRIGCVGSS